MGTLNVERMLVGQGNRQEPEKEDIKIYLQLFTENKQKPSPSTNISRLYNSSPFLIFSLVGKAFVVRFPRFVLNLDLNVFMLFIHDMKSDLRFVSRVLPLSILFHRDFVLQIKCKMG